MDKGKGCVAAAALLGSWLAAGPPARAATPVAVFNFQLTTAERTPDWVWLEKFLSDQITTDFHHDGKLSVIARDRMQLMAEELKWVPEMATQGRYHEAWLRFRQSSREDAAYAEAVYWVGKMYYFMDHYRHARRALERFVYLDAFHPRLGDALVEYLHTCENHGTSAEQLVELYAKLGRRFPGARVWEGTGWGLDRRGTMHMDEWLRRRSALLLGQIGRPAEAVDAWYAEPEKLRPIDYSNWPIMTRNVLEHYARTGQLVKLDVLTKELDSLFPDRVFCGRVLHFKPGEQAVVYQMARPQLLMGGKRRGLDKWAAFARDNANVRLCLIAPAGQFFTSLRCRPVAEGAGGNVALSLCPLRGGDSVVPPRIVDVAAARREGVSMDRLPRSGIVVLGCAIRMADDEGPLTLQGFGVSASLAELGPSGAIYVRCRNSNRFRVDVDGGFGRWNYGLVGLLAPGEHTVRLSGVGPGSPYGEWETTVTVVANRTARVVGQLPWKPGSPWSGWTAAGVESTYLGHNLRLHRRDGAPAIQADEEAIRLVWDRRGDLWSSVSRDGNTFSPPRKLDLPVSSGWLEAEPILRRDESGRFLLTFTSERDRLHQKKRYSCWSRDFVHWSAPAGVGTLGSNAIRDRDGRVLRTERSKDRVWIKASRDGRRWQRLGSVSPVRQGDSISNVLLSQRDDGRYDLFLKERLPQGPKHSPEQQAPYLLVHSVSADAQTWSPPSVLSKLTYGLSWPPLVTAYAEGRCFALANRFVGVFGGSGSCSSVLFCEDANGAWRRWGTISELVSGHPALGHHPRWGYMIAWSRPAGTERSTDPGAGPFLVRGASLESIATERLSSPRRPPPTPVDHSKPKVAAVPPGSIQYFMPDDDGRPGYSRASVSRLSGAEHFNRPARGSGTVNPNAMVATVKRGPQLLGLAFDSKEPGSAVFDVLRVDFTGRGDFRNACTIPRTRAFANQRDKRLDLWFDALPLMVTLRSRRVPVRVRCRYGEREVGSGKPLHRWLEIRLALSARGKCRFGKRTHVVELRDCDGNLRVSDPYPVSPDAGPGDLLIVDRGSTGQPPAAEGYYGHPVLVDGRLWDLTVSEDDMTIAATPYEGPTGSIRVDQLYWGAKFAGQKHLIAVRGGKKPVPVPVDRYRMFLYDERVRLSHGRFTHGMKLSGASLEGSHAVEFTLAAGQTKQIVIGSPLKGTWRAEQKGRAVQFGFSFTDVAGRPGPSMYTWTSQSWFPKIRVSVFDASGKLAAVCEGRLRRIEWRLPEGLKGTFTASPDFLETFPVELEKITFTVK